MSSSLEQIAVLRDSLAALRAGQRPDAIIVGGATGTTHAANHAGAVSELISKVHAVGHVASSGSNIGSVFAAAGASQEQMRAINKRADIAGLRDKDHNALSGDGVRSWLKSELDEFGADDWSAFDGNYQVGLAVWRTGLRRPDLNPEDLKDPKIVNDLIKGILVRRMPTQKFEQAFFPGPMPKNLEWLSDAKDQLSVSDVITMSCLRPPVYKPAILMNPETHELVVVMDGASLTNQPMPWAADEVPQQLVIDVRMKTNRDRNIDKLENMSSAASPFVLTLWLEGGNYKAMNFNLKERELDDRFGQGATEVDRCLLPALDRFEARLDILEQQILSGAEIVVTPEQNIAGQLLSRSL